MATNKKISELPNATLPIATGVKFEALQGGINVQVDADDMPGSSGGTSIPYGVTSGTNTYTIAASPTVTAYTDPMLLHIRVGNSSTSLVTLNVDGLGPKKLFDTAGNQAQDGYLKAGVDYLVVYNAALDTAAGGFTVVNELVHGVMNLRGTFVSAGGGVWPTGAGSGPGGGIRHGDVFIMGDADTLGAKTVNAGDFITTTVDNPGQTDSNWFVIPGPQAPRRSRTVTGADSIVPGDDNSIIIFNSATDFNFTLDQLTTGSKVQFMNINTGVVTFVNGTGVTVSPTAPTLSGAGSGVFPVAFVFYTSATTPILSSAYPESWLDWTPTFVGFGTDPTAITARYTLIGKTCSVRIFMTAGVSNATNFTITLPFTAAAGRVVYSIVIMNNGITQAGRCDTTGGSNILTMHASPAGGVWTNSGNKGAFFTAQYEIE